MTDSDRNEFAIREAVEHDARAVAGLFEACYGDDYLYPEFYEESGIKKLIFDDDVLVLVAEEVTSGTVVGSAGVLYEMGAYTDLVGEFGRLVVHPSWRGRGLGHRLMEERLARVADRMHAAFIEVRIQNAHSPRISQSHGFVAVGALPQKLVFGEKREHCGLMLRLFGEALTLRKNHPRIIPEAHHLSDVALRAVGVTPDTIVDEASAPYPSGGSFQLEELTEQGYSSLLRIERGRLRNREVFGPQRLHYGLFKLASSLSNYIIARDGDRVVGALGYMVEEVERHIRVFEVIQTDEAAVRFLFDALDAHCREEGIITVEVDVNAHAPRMQRTLLEMGYLPAAYVPAMAFHDVERLDVVKMYRLLGPFLDLEFDAPEPTLSVIRYVVERFRTQEVLPRLARAVSSLDLCAGLTEEQTARMLGEFETRRFDVGEVLFRTGDPPEEAYLVLEGSARIEVDGHVVGTVGSGEALGEVSFLTGADHSATAIAEEPMEVGTLVRGRLRGMVRRRPDIGTVVYRNLASGLADKLRRADLRLGQSLQ